MRNQIPDDLNPFSEVEDCRKDYLKKLYYLWVEVF